MRRRKDFVDLIYGMERAARSRRKRTREIINLSVLGLLLVGPALVALPFSSETIGKHKIFLWVFTIFGISLVAFNLVALVSPAIIVCRNLIDSKKASFFDDLRLAGFRQYEILVGKIRAEFFIWKCVFGLSFAGLGFLLLKSLSLEIARGALDDIVRSIVPFLTFSYLVFAAQRYSAYVGAIAAHKLGKFTIAVIITIFVILASCAVVAGVYVGSAFIGRVMGGSHILDEAMFQLYLTVVLPVAFGSLFMFVPGRVLEKVAREPWEGKSHA